MATTPAQSGILQKTFVFGDAAIASGVFEIGFLPPNSYITAIQCGVEVAFDGVSTNTLDVGITGAAANFANDISLAAVANASVTLLNSGEIQSATASTKIIGTVVSTATPNAGKARVTVTYVQI